MLFADASLAPSGEESDGSVIVTLRGAPLLWKSSRQPAVSLSTAEAELNELIEALMTGATVTAILEELGEAGEQGIETVSLRRSP